MNDEDEEPILITMPENATITPDDPDNAKYITVDTKEEKEYLEWLRDKETYSILGLRSKLTGMRLYQEWSENEASKDVMLKEEYQDMPAHEIIDKIREENSIDLD